MDGSISTTQILVTAGCSVEMGLVMAPNCGIVSPGQFLRDADRHR